MSNSELRTYWNEEWQLIETKAPTKENNYFISNYGRIKSVIKKTGVERLLKGSKGKHGRLTLSLMLKDDVRQIFYIHRLVGEYFLSKSSESHTFLIHLDQNLRNNHFENLKWFNRQELNNRWKELGLYKGINANHPNTKMTESKVKLLKQRVKKGKTKKRILAKQFNISVTQVNRILSGENWGNVN